MRNETRPGRCLCRMVRLSVLLTLTVCHAAEAQDLSEQQVLDAIQKAVNFYRSHVSVHGGSVYRVSADLSKREGEAKVGAQEAWIQPPATPTVGLTYLQAWQMTGLDIFSESMREVTEALIRGQLESGGWSENIEFDPAKRGRYAYRVDSVDGQQKRHNRTTFDDNKSQSALRFLMLLDRELQFQDAAVHEAARYALDAFQRAQYPNGAWPQRYSEFPDPNTPVRPARFPADWNRTYEKVSYTHFYTLNDNTVCDLIELMLTTHDVYKEPQWLQSAKRGGDFLLLAQLPEPQPGWAQQYDLEMEPMWARKFEPPAITGSESQRVIDTLMTLYDRTGDQKYLEPVPRALEYYRSLLLLSGQLARFYELGTDRPLYFTRDYRLVYTDDDLPTHYGFKVGSKLDRLEQRFHKLRQSGPSMQAEIPSAKPPRMTSKLRARAAHSIAALDDRGAWVEPGQLRNFAGDEQVAEVIDTRTYIRNLTVLAECFGAMQADGSKQ